jgi:hypothetical protein
MIAGPLMLIGACRDTPAGWEQQTLGLCSDNRKMSENLLPLVMVCGPSLVVMATWVATLVQVQRIQVRPITWVALGVVTANAFWASYIYFFYRLHPSPWQAPWRDPQILNYALLFLMAPIGMLLTFVAAARGAPKWLFWALELSSAPLLLIGFLATGAV